MKNPIHFIFVPSIRNKALLVLSILTIPMPVYFLVEHLKEERNHVYAGKRVDDRSIPIFVQFGLMGFYLLLCGNIFCSIQGAAEDRVR